MNRTIKSILVFLILLLLIPSAVYGAQRDISISHLVFMEDVTVKDKAEGHVAVVIGDADIQSDISGSLVVILGKATVQGTVEGDVVSVFGDVEIVKGSSIHGNLVSLGKIKKAPEVEINGTITAFNIDIISLFKSNGILINALIISSLIVLVMGLIFITIFSDKFRIMASSMNRRISRKLILGGLVIASFTIVLVFLVFLIVAPALYILVLMIADIMAAIFVGTIIFKKYYSRSAIYLEFFVGHILVSILKIVPLIYLPSGSYTALMIYGISYIILELLIACFGIGIIVDTAFGKKIEIS